MKTAVPQDEIKILKQLLQQRLQEQAALQVPFQVQCVLKDGDLLILVQHETSGASNPSSIFNTLHQAIESLPPSVSGSSYQQVHIYLRMAGQKQPYAADDFTIDTPVSSRAKASELENVLALEEEDHPANPWDYQTREVDPAAPGGRWTVDFSSDEIDSSQSTDVASSLGNSSKSKSQVEFQSQRRSSNEETSSGVPLPLLAVGAGMAGLLSFGGVYALTRPCVMGTCPQLLTAQQLSQDSIQTVRKAKSAQELAGAQQQLVQANQLLQSIPPWSRHHATAQKQLESYTTQSRRLEGILTALNKANEAAQKSLNPPHSVQEWQKIQSSWGEAIAQLRQVRPNNPVYPLAQQRLQDYQLNLAIVTQRIKTEQQAEQKLIEAKQTAQVAQARMGNARSFENWQQVYSSWQAATNALTTVPPTTMAYKEAQQLLLNYRPKLIAARDRSTKEQISANNYNQAVSLAAVAKRLEQQNQWSLAVATWRQASTFAQQVPTGTFYYAQTQQLIDAYANALKQAEASLRISLIQQKARLDLNRTCGGITRICNFTVTNQGINVYLTPDYYNRVVRTAATANMSGDYNTQVALQDHIQTLQAALETISENANLPLALYDHRRTLLGTYSPKR